MIRNEERSGLVFTIAGGAILLVALLAFLGFFHEPQHPTVGAAQATPRRLGSVAGDVVDSLTGRALAETNLDVSGLDGVSDHWREPADPELPRHFELKGLPADRDFTLEISSPGHVAERRAARVPAGGTAELGEIRLVPLATIRGTVVDANYQPVGDAELTCVREGAETGSSPSTGRADAHGTFRIEGLLPGVWSVDARTKAGERCDVAATVDAHVGGEAAPVEVEVFPTFSIRGRLKLPIGTPAPESVVAASSIAPVAADGSFAVSNLFAGLHRLTFQFADAQRSSAAIGCPNDAVDLDSTRLQEGLNVEVVHHFGSAGAGAESSTGPCTLVVRVVDADGKPLAGALVDLVFNGAAGVTRATARNGETTFRGIVAGRASRIVARFGDRRSFDPREVGISERSSGAPFELRCVPIHALAVKVVSATGTAVPHAHVAVDASSAESDDGGVARFDELPPPPWKTEVGAGDAFETWSSPSVSPDADGNVTITLAVKGDAKSGSKNDHP